MTMQGASRRTADVLLVLALDRDPDLGYTSDPEITRVLWWVALPGVALVLALGTWSAVRLVRSSVAAWVLTVLGGASVALCLAGPVLGLVTA